MKTSDFDYHLPEELIAQTPCEPRDASRLMVLHRAGGDIEHRRFFEIGEYLREGDVMVFNESRVMPARLAARRPDGAGKIEILLLRRRHDDTWEALVRPGRRLRTGDRCEIAGDNGAAPVLAEVVGQQDGGVRLVRFSDETRLTELGRVPLPPYIHEPLADPERYQTIYSRVSGSVAAPTAGLHFTRELLAKLENKGVKCVFVTLHISLDTFRPVREEDPLQHPIFREHGSVSPEAAREISEARMQGRRVICVGTTSTRIVEHAARLGDGSVRPFEGWADLFILPGHRFQALDALVTNFHLPRSTLLMLVTAFAGNDLLTKAYREAVKNRYRFYSFGDAMLLL